MKPPLFLFLFLVLFYCDSAFANCDDSPGPCWVTTLAVTSGTAGGILNATSIGFNVYNAANPKPMNKTGKVFTYGTIAVGALTSATGIVLFTANHSRASSTNIINGIVVGTGVTTISSAILSLAMDQKQKSRGFQSVSVIPIIQHDSQSGTMGGMFLTKGF